ncbi:nucleotidyltransferase family protein [Flavobacteriaceae bacterium]|nr:nucleotidyltransferase family protein [Flavobacteriaceae bacterium]
MSKRFTTYQTIADILSFTTSNTSLEATLRTADVDWDAIVVHGSRQLVIPTLYCRLKQRQLLHLLPEDLDLYLHDITSQNRKRNKAILKEVTMLSTLFKKHHIEHVFLKGAALLASGYYEDIAERMIGDIDILVATNQLDKAFELLQQHSFKPLPLTFADKYFYHRHLPRLITNKYIAAVELHRKLFNTSTKKELSNELLLKNKRIQNDIFVSSTEHLIEHNILNHEINDEGYRYQRINFRSVYDTLILCKSIYIVQPSRNIIKELCENKYLRNYFNKTNVLLNDLKNEYSKQAKFFRFCLNNPKLNYWKDISIKRMGDIKILVNRLIKFLSNSHYRRDLWDNRYLVIAILKAKF